MQSGCDFFAGFRPIVSVFAQASRNVDAVMRSALPIVLFGAAMNINALEMPVGIPQPVGPVPTAIIPDLPSASVQRDGFPYDPIETATPVWTDAVSQYYIDSSAGNCSNAANGGRGAPDEPRCSIPGLGTNSGGTWNLSAGDQLFIVGDGATYHDGSDVQNVDMRGTASAQIWIIGVGDTAPEFRMQRFFTTGGMSHVFWENVHFRSPTDDFRATWSQATAPIEFITFRGIQCSGSDGQQSPNSRRCFSLGGNAEHTLQFVVFHDVDVFGLGRWQDDFNTSTDMHGFQMQRYTRYVWILDSRIYHNQGDSIQCGNSNWFDYNYASRPHYIYIGRTEMFENYENAFDDKGCYHVVLSENNIHDFFNSVKGANGTALIPEQDSEGDVGGRYTWFVNNEVHNVSVAVGAKATTDDAYPRIVGNLFYDVRSSVLDFTQRCYSGGSAGQTCPIGFTWAQNTADCGLQATAITNPQNPNGSDQQVDFHGNIFYNCVDGREDTPHNWESFSREPLNITYQYNRDYRTSGGNIQLPLDAFDTYSAADNATNVAIEFSNSSARDYTLVSASALDAIVPSEHPDYQLFEDLYGLDIRQDLNGNRWTAGSRLNAGAFQDLNPGAPVAPQIQFAP